MRIFSISRFPLPVSCLPVALAWLVAAASGLAWASPDVPPAEAAPGDAGGAAAELFQRAVALFRAGNLAEARNLFLQALAASPDGPYAASARAMAERCEASAGAAGADGPPTLAPLDPYANGQASTPTADGRPNGERIHEPIDPYSRAEGRGDIRAAIDARLRGGRGAEGSGRRQLLAFSSVFGAAAALAVFDLAGGSGAEALLPVLAGAGAGLGAGYLVARSSEPGEADVAVIASASAWGGLVGGLAAKIADSPSLCDVGPDCTGAEDVTGRAYSAAILAGGVVGLGGGVALSHFVSPSAGDVALASSLGGYGLLSGLLIGAMIQPPDERAYAVNALAGSSIGMSAALMLARRIDATRAQMARIDLGVAGGAAVGFVLGRAIGDDSGNDREQLSAALALGGMVAGGWLAARSAGILGGEPTVGRGASRPPPALLARGGDGQWRFGGLALEPIASPLGRAPLPGVSVLAGRF